MTGHLPRLRKRIMIEALVIIIFIGLIASLGYKKFKKAGKDDCCK